MTRFRLANKLYVIFLLFTGVGLITGCLFFLHTPYETLIHSITITIQKNGVEHFLRTKVFPLNKYLLVRKVCWFCLLLIPIVLIACFYLRNSFLNAAKSVFSALRASFRSVIGGFRSESRSARLVLTGIFGFIMLRSLYYLIVREPAYDEVWCYNYYTAQPFYYTFFMYSNYPLYELCTQLFKWLPFPMIVNLRLPAMLAGIGACAIVYASVNAWFRNHAAGTASLAAFAFLPVITCFMLFGRGVMFEIFFAVAALAALLFWIRDSTRNDRLIIFVLSNIAAFYSMPSHFYCWLFFFFVAMASGRISVMARKRFLIANALVLVGVIACYLPVALGSGFSFVTDILTVHEHFQWSRMFNTEIRVSGLVTGSYYGLIVLFAACVVPMPEKKPGQSAWIRWSTAGLLVLPMVAYCIQRILIPERALSFVALAVPLFAAGFVTRFPLFLSKKTGAIACILVVVAGVTISHFHESINWSRDLDRESEQVTGIFLQHEVTTCYDATTDNSFGYHYPAIEFFYRQRGKTILFTTSTTNSIRFRQFNPAERYDCIVLPFAADVSPWKNSYDEIFLDRFSHYKILMLRRV